MGLMDAVYTYEALEIKYGNFTVPALEISFPDDNLLKVTGPEAGILSLEVCLSMDEPGSAIFTIGGCYDMEQSSFGGTITSLCIPGKKIEVYAGYLSEKELIFSGVICAVERSFGREIQLVVTAMDVRWLMNCGRREKIHKVSSCSAAVTAILGDYSWLCGSETDATTDETTSISQAGSDYRFITEEIISRRLIDRDFFVVGGTAYFIEPDKYDAPIVTLKRGEGLLHFSRTEILRNLNLELRLDSSEGRHKSEELVQGDDQLTNLDYVQTSWYGGSLDEAEQQVQTLAARKLRKARQSSGRCIGMPVLVPGRYVSLAGLDSDSNGDYFLVKVVHQIDEDGFFTEFEGRGWNV